MRYLIEPATASGTAAGHRQAVEMLYRLTGSRSIEYLPSGAPYLSDRQVFVSISHCRTAVAVAVDEDGPVGIDIESRRRVNNSLIGRVCTAAEQALVEGSDDPTMAFLQLWTRKEAALKCRGTGIRGFASLQNALHDPSVEVHDIATTLPDTVAAVARLKA